MAWAKVDDRFFSHPKVVGTGLAARGLWITALSWSSAMETDGWIPESVLWFFAHPNLIPELTQELVDARLWERGDRGFRIHDFLDWNPSRATVLARRQAGAARLAAYRERKRESNALSPRDCNASETPTPTRPDPSRSDLPSEDPHVGLAARKRRADRAAPLPTDFSFPEERRRFAEAGGISDPGLEFAQFKDHHRAKGSLMYDWEAAWKTWCRNAIKYAASRQQRR
jgi:hypothetical protein